jgi:hypothetical protein
LHLLACYLGRISAQQVFPGLDREDFPKDQGSCGQSQSGQIDIFVAFRGMTIYTTIIGFRSTDFAFRVR